MIVKRMKKLKGGNRVPVRACGGGYGAMGDLALMDVYAFLEGRVVVCRIFKAEGGELEDIVESYVRQGKGRRARDGAGHVGHAVVQNAVNLIDRI